MSTISALGLILLILMVIVGGRQGWIAFWSLLLNFCFLFLAVVLIAMHFPPLAITILTGVIILAITIFMGRSDLTTTVNAYYASLIVFAIILLLIIPVEHLARVQGFGLEDTDALEGMSLQIGLSFQSMTVVVTSLSSLGAIAEAAMSVASGMATLLEAEPEISCHLLLVRGLAIGRQIMGTALNTLFFGFFGGFLALFIWFAGLNYSFGTIMNDKIFVNELLIVLISFIGVLLSVPITAWMIAWRRNDKKHVNS